MSRNLLDPLIMDTLVHQPIVRIPQFDWSKFLASFRSSNILGYLIPVVVFMFIIFIIKVKWDNKQNKNYNIKI